MPLQGFGARVRLLLAHGADASGRNRYNRRTHRENALLDYFSGGFDGPGEGVLLVHGSVSRSLAPSFLERLQRVAQDFAQQHQADQKLPAKDCEGYTLLLAMRSWEFAEFEAMRR